MHSVLGSYQQLESRAGGTPPGKCMAPAQGLHLPRACVQDVSGDQLASPTICVQHDVLSQPPALLICLDPLAKTSHIQRCCVAP